MLIFFNSNSICSNLISVFPGKLEVPWGRNDSGSDIHAFTEFFYIGTYSVWLRENQNQAQGVKNSAYLEQLLLINITIVSLVTKYSSKFATSHAFIVQIIIDAFLLRNADPKSKFLEEQFSSNTVSQQTDFREVSSWNFHSRFILVDYRIEPGCWVVIIHHLCCFFRGQKSSDNGVKSLKCHDFHICDDRCSDPFWVWLDALERWISCVSFFVQKNMFTKNMFVGKIIFFYWKIFSWNCQRVDTIVASFDWIFVPKKSIATCIISLWQTIVATA